MPKSQTIATTAPAAEPKARRIARPSAKKTALPPPESLQQLAAAVEFNAAAHYDEIAQAAYRNWLERTSATSADDWLRAETEVRAKYGQ
jgi:hypothetical protein